MIKLTVYLILLHMFISIPFISGSRRNKSGTTSTTPNPVSGLLNKFHQNDYKLIYERSELVRFNPKFGEFHVVTYKFNRTTPLTNISFTVWENANNDTEVIAQAYRFASNEYRLFPIRLELNVCELLASKAIGLEKMYKGCGNIVCPLLKEKKYYVNNFAPDESKFPPLIPSGKYMLELQFLYDSEETFLVRSYGTIDRPIPYT